MNERLTTIQFVQGQDAGGAQRVLNDAQRAGRECLVCRGTENLNEPVGWVDGVNVRVHSWHLEHYRMGETLPPN
jgi:hypothetical protein